MKLADSLVESLRILCVVHLHMQLIWCPPESAVWHPDLQAALLITSRSVELCMCPTICISNIELNLFAKVEVVSVYLCAAFHLTLFERWIAARDPRKPSNI